MYKVVVLDDDPDALNLICHICRQAFEVQATSTFAELKACLTQYMPHAVVLDLHLSQGTTFEYLDLLRLIYPSLGIVVLTGDSRPGLARDLIDLGADDFIIKTELESRLLISIESAISSRRTAQEVRIQSAQAHYFRKKYFVPDHDVFRHVVAEATHAIQVGLNVLLLGETGTGKDMLAQYIRDSAFPSTSFIPVNCSAIPINLAESEFFGYEKGAFTDAGSQKIGLIESSADGILFLDEIGSMPLDIQGKLLRVLEDHGVRRVGGTEVVPVQFRLICATNVNLEVAITQQRFRDDLYYRINQVTIRLPSLRSYPELIPQYVSHFWEENNRKTNQSKPLPLYQIQNWMTGKWPGNIRQLKNEIEKYFLLGNKDEFVSNKQHFSLSEKVNLYEQALINQALEQTQNNISAAARLLNIKRETLQKKVLRYQRNTKNI